MTQHPEEGTLHAYIDGELTPAETAELEAHVAGCESCAAALAEARGLVAAASRAISALDVAPSSARPVSSAPATAVPLRRKVRPPIFRVPYARAAALLLLVGGTAVVVDRSGVLDGEGGPRTELLTVDEAMPSQAAPIPAPEAVALAAPEAAPQAAPSNPSPRSAGRAAAASTGNAVAATRAAAGVAADAATRNRVDRMVNPPASVSVVKSQEASSASSLKAVVPTGAADRSSVGTAAPAVPAAPPAALSVRASEPLTELAVTGVSSAPVRVTRYRTKEGTVLTLTEESSRASFAEEAAGARRAAAQGLPPRAAPQAAQAGAPAPAVNTYRWTSAQQGRTYTLTGALPVAELEALSKRLGELERVP